jgi:hypothetical protein
VGSWPKAFYILDFPTTGWRNKMADKTCEFVKEAAFGRTLTITKRNSDYSITAYYAPLTSYDRYG